MVYWHLYFNQKDIIGSYIHVLHYVSHRSERSCCLQFLGIFDVGSGQFEGEKLPEFDEALNVAE